MTVASTGLCGNVGVAELAWRAEPLEVLRAWPEDVPIALLASGGEVANAGEAGRPWNRWTIMGVGTRLERWRAAELAGGGFAERLSGLIGTGSGASAMTREGVMLPFAGGWIGWLSYELGGLIEPAAQGGRATDDRGWPVAEFWRCPAAYIGDGLSGRWYAVGDRALLPDIHPESNADNAWEEGAFRIRVVKSMTGQRAYERAVARTVEYVRAGDVFQANITHRLGGQFEGSTRGLFAAMARQATPWYGAYIESGDDRGMGRAVSSISPELFLEFDPATRRVVTRPIKGTGVGPAGAGTLGSSAKDQAELVMIVDLMRNDLGRVCEVGSVRVEEPRVIERHGGAEETGVWHGVGTVVGTLRRDRHLGDLIEATFPAGSVTGAPKIRAMRIIDELEPVARGAYCGAIGCFSDCGSMTLSVGIRTACVSGELTRGRARIKGIVDYGVGAGIVAESDPASEWRETLAKAACFLRVADAQTIE